MLMAGISNGAAGLALGGGGIIALAVASASAASCAACCPAPASSLIFSIRAASASSRLAASSAAGPCQLSCNATACSRSTSACVVNAVRCCAHSAATVLTSATSASRHSIWYSSSWL
jgi:hypothetical protein